MSITLELPPAPAHYSQRDQDELRRRLAAALRDLDQRLTALGG